VSLRPFTSWYCQTTIPCLVCRYARASASLTTLALPSPPALFSAS
jgi:hypothetical protein